MAPTQPNDLTVYSGTYSNVPVYELRIGVHLVMRRRSDSYINATHILKVADLDKPARTRVLEKEVQLGVHEKVQGGYGKYQGTWIPLESGVDLAKKYSVFHLLQPLFEFVPGPQSPPPAPKHATASANRSKAAKASAAAQAAQNHYRQAPANHVASEPRYDYENRQEYVHEDESFDNATIASHSFVDEEDYPMTGGSRKRRRGNDQDNFNGKNMSAHRLWADSLLDYYVVSGSDPNHQTEYAPPPPPEGVEVNKPVDNEGHTALHWAASMGDIEYVKDLMKLNADMFIGNIRGETPLIKCSIFANCYDKGTYQAMLGKLSPSLTVADKFGATVLHHITKSTLGVPRASRARYYLDVALDQLEKNMNQTAFYDFANRKDQNGDTAFHIAVRASRRCTRVFQAKGIPCDVPNAWGETVEKMLRDKDEKNATRRKRMRAVNHPFMSSSPVAPSSPAAFDNSPAVPNRFNDLLGRSSRLSAKSSQTFSDSMQNFYTTAVSTFMQAGEDEMNAKDLLLVDLETALSRVNTQIIAAQQECEILESEPYEDVATLSEERARLAKDAEAFSEQLQHKFLHQAIREGENKARSKHERKTSDIHGLDSSETGERIKVALQLHDAQERRKGLTSDLVEGQADAGMEESGELALRVLMKILSAAKEKVVSMIPDLLEELRMNREEQTPSMDIEVE